MNHISIKKSEFPFRGYYASHVLEWGHITGVLSGSEIKGKARHYGAWYHSVRTRVAEWALSHCGVSSSLLLINGRYARVWVKDGEQIEFSLNRETY